MNKAPQMGRGALAFQVEIGRSSAATAADRCAVEAHIAAATVLETTGQCLAARLDDLATGLVARATSDAAAVIGVLTLADPAAQFAFTNRDAVELAAN
jgi:hypothetical protein